MTTEERQIVEEMVENNIYEAVFTLLRDLAHGVPASQIDPTPYKELNKRIRRLVNRYHPQIVQNYLRQYKSEQDFGN